MDHDPAIVVKEVSGKLLVGLGLLLDEVVQLFQGFTLGDWILLLDTLEDEKNLLWQLHLLLNRFLFSFAVILHFSLLLLDVSLRALSKNVDT